MSDDAHVAVESPPEPKQRQRPSDQKPKKQPPYTAWLAQRDGMGLVADGRASGSARARPTG